MIKGGVIWITGLSGAGKTTIATALTKKFGQTCHQAILLDGDQLREVLGNAKNFQPEARRELAMIYARLARYLANQNQVVICATISMFHDVRFWNRENNLNYFEIYLRVPRQILVKRDPKGLYGRGSKSETGNDAMVGIEAQFEEPLSPDVLIENHGQTSTEIAINIIWDSLKKKTWIS